MTNRIRRVVIRSHSTVPASAEIHVHVVPEKRTPSTEIRGRLMGPSCPYASTVEVAYALRPLPIAADGEELRARVIVPEASLWEPVSPFLYAGPVELWEDEKLCERVTVQYGLRSLALGPRGLRLNGRLLSLRGRTVTSLTETEAVALHRTGFNLLVAPVTADSQSLWDMADRLGFLMIGRLVEGDVTEDLLARLKPRPCCLGFVLAAGTRSIALGHADIRIGAEITTDGMALPWGAAFAICSDAGLAPAQLPFLVMGAAPQASSPLCLGHIE